MKEVLQFRENKKQLQREQMYQPNIKHPKPGEEESRLRESREGENEEKSGSKVTATTNTKFAVRCDLPDGAWLGITSLDADPETKSNRNNDRGNVKFSSVLCPCHY